MLQKPSIFVLLIVAALYSCKKDKQVQPPPVTIHCNALVNDVLPPGDNGAVFVASAFSANGDGLNDGFRVLSRDIKSISIKIFDSTSTLVHQASQLNDTWFADLSGKPYKRYYYRVEAITQMDKKIGKCGEVFALSCYPAGKNKNSFTFEDQFNGSGFIGTSNETLVACP